MALNPEEVSSVIKKELEKYETKLEMESVGTVLQVGDGIARIHGLDKAMAGELLEFPGGLQGVALNVDETDLGEAEFDEAGAERAHRVVVRHPHRLRRAQAAEQRVLALQLQLGEAPLPPAVDRLAALVDCPQPLVNN